MTDDDSRLMQDVLDFWFGEEASETYAATRPEWFKKDPEFDRTIDEQFGPAVAAALDGAYGDMAETPNGMLALVLLLDQFPRNLFRASARAFAGDERALQLAKQAVRLGFDQEFAKPQQMFFYLPFEHCESIDDQRRCIDLFRAAGNTDMGKWAQAHFDIVERFGRFPHRNAVLGRQSTAEEIAFLEQPNSSF